MLLNKEQLTKLQQTELEMLKSFIDVCEKLNITYYVVEGTLLGAVRHNGFIPWDDDIDIGIMREDYDKFLEKASELLPSHLFLQTYDTDSGYPRVFAKIRNSNTTFIETAVKDNKMNHGVYIDIFPLDRCDFKKRNSFWFRNKEKLLSLRTTSLFSNMKLSSKAKLFRLISCFLYPSAKKALVKLEKMYRSMPNGEMIVNFSGVYGQREIMPKEWYGEGTKISFEGVSVTVPLEYAKVLSQVYGNYMQMPPIEKRVTHHQTEVIDTEKAYEAYLK